MIHGSCGVFILTFPGYNLPMQEKTTPEQEIVTLVSKLSEYSHKYYVLGRPEVTDLEYDRLYDRLVQLEKAHPKLVLSYSPTQRVGSDLSSELEEGSHSLPVLSLDKAYSPEEILTWAEKTAKNSQEDLVLTLEEKLDGASIVLYYENGILDRALTRGNGLVGNVVTANVKTISKVPLKLPEPLTIAVRGEIFMRKSEFERVNRTLAEPYSNPRNLAAGTLRRVVSSEVAKVPLDIFVYEGFFDPPMESYREVRSKLQSLGFPLSTRFEAFSTGVVQPGTFPVSTLAQHLEKARIDRPGLDYEIDGLVMKVDRLRVRDRLGLTGHHPRWAVAFKFEAPQGETLVESIDLQVGRTGRVTPVARVKPVVVGGAQIANVTLHNQDYIEALELGVGDRVTISRRGDVIPAVDGVVEKLSDHVWRMGTACPVCQTLLVKNGAHHFCPNPLCPEQVRGRLNFFTAKDQMDLGGLGPETMEVLISRGLVKDVPDLFTCDFSLLEGVPGFGEKKISALKEGVDKARTRDFPVVLASLGIPELGKKISELLVEHGVDSWDNLVSLVKNPSALLSIPGIGDKTVETLSKEVLRPETLEMVEKLKLAGLHFQIQGSVGPVSREWDGQTWCVTGSFVDFNPRSKAEQEIKARGARVVSAVSGATTHLLAGEGAGSKLTKAQSLGIQIITEEIFMKLLERTPQ